MKFVNKPLGASADASRSQETGASFAKNVSVLIVAAIALYGLSGVLVDVIISAMPEDTEVSLFAGISNSAVPEALNDQRAQRIFAQLIEQPELKPYPYTLRSLPMKVPNAGALPGGVIGVTPALLKTIKTDIGLAMVLAHELGHQHHRHSLRRLGRSMLWQAFTHLFTTDLTGAHQIGMKLLQSSHSRDEEREADAFGLRLVHKTYGDLTHATEFFEWAQQKHGRAESLSRFISSHPMSAERIRNMKRLARELEKSEHE